MTALLFALRKLDALPIQMGSDLKLKFFLWKLNIENKKYSIKLIRLKHSFKNTIVDHK